MSSSLRKKLLISKIVEEGKKDNETLEDYYNRIISVQVAYSFNSPVLLPRISLGDGYGYKPISITSYNKGKKPKIFKFDYLDELLVDLNKSIDK